MPSPQGCQVRRDVRHRDVPVAVMRAESLAAVWDAARDGILVGGGVAGLWWRFGCNPIMSISASAGHAHQWGMQWGVYYVWLRGDLL